MSESMGDRFRPIGKRVLVEQVEGTGMSEGGILLPETAQEVPRTGKVVAVGTKRVCDGLIREGSLIVYKAFGGSIVTIERTEYLVVDEDEILGVMPG